MPFSLTNTYICFLLHLCTDDLCPWLQLYVHLGTSNDLVGCLVHLKYNSDIQIHVVINLGNIHSNIETTTRSG